MQYIPKHIFSFAWTVALTTKLRTLCFILYGLLFVYRCITVMSCWSASFKPVVCYMCVIFNMKWHLQYTLLHNVNISEDIQWEHAEHFVITCIWRSNWYRSVEHIMIRLWRHFLKCTGHELRKSADYMKMFDVVFLWIIFVPLIYLNTELKPMWDFNALWSLHDAAYDIFRSFLDETNECLRFLEPESEDENVITQNNMSRISSLILLCVWNLFKLKEKKLFEMFYDLLWCQCKVLYTYFYRTIGVCF